MATFFQCFRKKQRDNSNEQIKYKCKCAKVNKVLQCEHCKSTLVGYWERDGTDGADGGACSKIISNTTLCMDLQDASVNGDSSSDGNSPVNSVPTRNTRGNNNTGFYMSDYRPSAQSNISGMSYMPVSKNDPNYNMKHRRRGKAVIFNFAQWDNTNIPSMDLAPRQGSEKDKSDLADCLKNLSFEVVCYDNLKRQVYDRIIDELRMEDHTEADCLVIAIMTHGEKNSIYLSDGSLIPVNSVWEEFEANACPTLAGKPKIFIIQACRGDRYDHGTRLLNERGQVPNVQNDVTDSGTFSYVIPNAADIIVAFSCPLGHYSWRHPERGSWFIQSLCKVFNSSGNEMELKSLLTAVSREVAVNYESNTTHHDSNKKKQVPSTSSTLIRNVFFTPKENPTIQPIINGNTVQVSSYVQSAEDQANGNSISNAFHVFNVPQVRAAVAQAQSSRTENFEVNAEMKVTTPSEIPPLVLSVLDGVQSQTENGNIAVEVLNSVVSNDLPGSTLPVDQTVQQNDSTP